MMMTFLRGLIASTGMPRREALVLNVLSEFIHWTTVHGFPLTPTTIVLRPNITLHQAGIEMASGPANAEHFRNVAAVLLYSHSQSLFSALA
jgi:hypothetical protein